LDLKPRPPDGSEAIIATIEIDRGGHLVSKNLAAGLLIFLLFLTAFAALTKSEPASWNDVSRIAAIESLANRGTWAIDDSPWLDLTQDKIQIGGKFYSDKMPVLSLIGAGVYTIARNGFGAVLVPDCAKNGRICAYYYLTLVLVGGPVALMLMLFFHYTLEHGLTMWPALVGTFALGMGTMMLPFALVFNHHAPAAACLFASFYLIVKRPATSLAWIIVAGVLAALALSFDAVSGVIAASLVGIAAVRYRGRLVYFLFGAAFPLALTAFLDYQIAHSIIPPYMITSAYAYPGSVFPATIGGNGTPDDYVAYSFRMFVGAQGLFAYNPLLLVALAGALLAAVRPQNGQRSLRVEAIFTLVGFVLLCLYLSLGTGNLGGVAYGERWFVNAIPTLFSFIIFMPPLIGGKWKNAGWLFFLPLLALSVFSSLQGAQRPWLYTPPPLQLTRGTDFPILGLRWNVRLP
jgi:hypothetical protein